MCALNIWKMGIEEEEEDDDDHVYKRLLIGYEFFIS
jgi:hypothetical protein